MDAAVFNFWTSAIAVGIVAFVQIAFPWLDRQIGDFLPRVIAVARGVAVGYVALLMLPKIGDYTAVFSARTDVPERVGYRLYFFFLAGLLVYFLVDRSEAPGQTLPIWIHGGAFTFYSFATGYVISDVPRPGYFPFILAGLTFGLHFMGICHQLREWNPVAFGRYIRWFMSVALMVGWAAGLVDAFSKNVLSAIVAFLGGGILVNVLREEWPDKGRIHTWGFLFGVALYVTLIVIVRSFTGERV